MTAFFLLDEFPSIGAVDYIKSKSGLIAGYKLKLLIVYQVGSQLEKSTVMRAVKHYWQVHPAKSFILLLMLKMHGSYQRRWEHEQ